MLAISFDEVQRRVARRGSHTATLATEPDAEQIADSFLNACCADEQKESFFGIAAEHFREVIYSNHLVWVPDGDEAFDDGSYVLQFDVADRVRLVAFKQDDNYVYDRGTLRGLWVGSDTFYEVLQQWSEAFEAEWKSLPKTTS